MREKRKTLLILYKIEKKILCDIAVVPLAGTWIEIDYNRQYYLRNKSFPSRERGLKCTAFWLGKQWIWVVPLAGTWIEIELSSGIENVNTVVPLAGTWIEIKS